METGWVIERAESSQHQPLYWTGPQGWSADPLEAIRFARELDAERVASQLPAATRVIEHMWS